LRSCRPRNAWKCANSVQQQCSASTTGIPSSARQPPPPLQRNRHSDHHHFSINITPSSRCPSDSPWRLRGPRCSRLPTAPPPPPCTRSSCRRPGDHPQAPTPLRRQLRLPPQPPTQTHRRTTSCCAVTTRAKVHPHAHPNTSQTDIRPSPCSSKRLERPAYACLSISLQPHLIAILCPTDATTGRPPHQCGTRSDHRTHRYTGSRSRCVHCGGTAIDLGGERTPPRPDDAVFARTARHQHPAVRTGGVGCVCVDLTVANLFTDTCAAILCDGC
jgi:hypothetical protein